MGVRIMEGREVYDGAVLYCSTSMWAFGPVFTDRDEAQAFCDWLGDKEPRTMTDKELEGNYLDFLAEREDAKVANDE